MRVYVKNIYIVKNKIQIEEFTKSATPHQPLRQQHRAVGAEEGRTDSRLGKQAEDSEPDQSHHNQSHILRVHSLTLLDRRVDTSSTKRNHRNRDKSGLQCTHGITPPNIIIPFFTFRYGF